MADGIHRSSNEIPDANRRVVIERIGASSGCEEDRPLVSAPTVAEESARITNRTPLTRMPTGGEPSIDTLGGQHEPLTH